MQHSNTHHGRFGYPFGGMPNVFEKPDFHSRLFKLWDPEDKRDFDVVMDRIYGGWYAERRRHDRWCEEHMGYIVWLEWLQIYGESTNGKTITPFR